VLLVALDLLLDRLELLLPFLPFLSFILVFSLLLPSVEGRDGERHQHRHITSLTPFRQLILEPSKQVEVAPGSTGTNQPPVPADDGRGIGSRIECWEGAVLVGQLYQ